MTLQRLQVRAAECSLLSGLVAKPRTVLNLTEGRGRKSIRLESTKRYNDGLFIITLDHAPTGKAVNATHVLAKPFCGTEPRGGRGWL